jgi:hypothetical protein
LLWAQLEARNNVPSTLGGAILSYMLGSSGRMSSSVIGLSRIFLLFVVGGERVASMPALLATAAFSALDTLKLHAHTDEIHIQISLSHREQRKIKSERRRLISFVLHSAFDQFQEASHRATIQSHALRLRESTEAPRGSKITAQSLINCMRPGATSKAFGPPTNQMQRLNY